MPAAYCLIRQGPEYRSEAFHAGLRAAGYDLRHSAPGGNEAGNVMVGWNRYGSNHDLATRFERAGGTYLCAENAYIWIGGMSPHHVRQRPAYALARGYHNDAEVVRMGQADRWSALAVNVVPFRESGGYVLICPNRPFGTPGRAMPDDWPQKAAARFPGRQVRIRPHPGNAAPHKPLAADLEGASVCVIWSSSAGVHALVAGVPVICDAPFWICKRAAGAEPPEDRLTALRRLAYAQFSVEEIASGEPFRMLLQ